jgi:hypothetical protein
MFLTASVSVWMSLTWAPGTAAPEVSCTVPETWEVETAWPQMAAVIPQKHATKRIDLTVIAPPFVYQWQVGIAGRRFHGCLRY